MRAEKIDALSRDITDVVCQPWVEANLPNEHIRWHSTNNKVKQLIRKHCNKKRSQPIRKERTK